MKPSKLAWIGVLPVLGAWLGCNAVVVVEPGEPGSGGSAPTTSSSATGGGGASTTTGTTGTAISGTTTGTGTTTTGSGGCALGVPDPMDCATACSALYDCGALECDGMTLCQFTGDAAEKAVFVGDAMSGCMAGCQAQMALINLVDPGDCATTIATIKGASADFADFCDNGTGSP